MDRIGGRLTIDGRIAASPALDIALSNADLAAFGLPSMTPRAARSNEPPCHGPVCPVVWEGGRNASPHPDPKGQGQQALEGEAITDRMHGLPEAQPVLRHEMEHLELQDHVERRPAAFRSDR